MSDALDRGNACPAAGEWARLFEAEGPTVVSTLGACNISTALEKFDVRVALAGAEEADEQYRYHQSPLPAGFPYAITAGWTLLEGDVVWVRSLGGRVAFNLSVTEII